MDEIRAEEAQASACALASMKAALEAFRHYSLWLDSAHNGTWNDQVVDADKRIVQALMILTRIDELLAHQRKLNIQIEMDFDLYAIDPNRALLEWHARCQGSEGQAILASISDVDWLQLHTEQFYWVTFRARSAMRQLPELGKFDPRGVRNTRNKLIEHPEGSDSLIFNGGFAFGGAKGPVLAAARTDQQSDTWQDAGLFPNADEFAANLVSIVSASIAGPPTNFRA